MTDFREGIAMTVRKLEADRSAWLEDIAAGLLSNGVMRDEIDVQIHPANVWIVAVRGKPRYRWTMRNGGEVLP